MDGDAKLGFPWLFHTDHLFISNILFEPILKVLVYSYGLSTTMNREALNITKGETSLQDYFIMNEISLQ